MKVVLAETAGFCFGVDRAVNMVEELLTDGKKVATLGPIIHNPQLVEDLGKRGARIVESPDDVADDEVLVLRSHGVARCVVQKAAELGLTVADATCPFVAKIHKIVAAAGEQGRTVLIAGDAHHKEVEGLIGHCTGKFFTFNSEEDLVILQKNDEIDVDGLKINWKSLKLLKRSVHTTFP